MPPSTAERLYRQVAQAVRTWLQSGAYAPGERLPAERDLAARFGVSRASLREALVALEVEGAIEVRGGAGIYVSAMPSAAATAAETANPEWGPLEVLETRRVLEGETAAAAAAHSGAAGLRAIAAALDAMRGAVAIGASPLAHDRAFHRAIAAAAGNAVMGDLLDLCWASREGAVYRGFGRHFDTSRSWRAALAEHEAIHCAIRSRDTTAARVAMHAHLDHARGRLRARWPSLAHAAEPSPALRPASMPASAVLAGRVFLPPGDHP